MKQFLVPALLLAFVATTAVVAAGSAAPPASQHPSRAFCPPTAQCPYSDERCLSADHGAACPAAAQEAADECKRCSAKPDAECCRRKLGCPDCRDGQAKEPQQKP